MAKAEYAMSYDGVFYKKGEELPDLGSWECVECNGMKRDYEGLSKDLDKLPHYVDTGSSALKKYLVFHK